MLKVVHEESEPNVYTPVAVGGSMLDELVRDGARAMLAAALQAEVAAYVDAHVDQVDEAGRRRDGVQAHRVRTNPLAGRERTPPRRSGPCLSDVQNGILVERPDESGGDQQVA